MEVTVRKVTDWDRVLNAARMTVHKDAVDKMPSNTFKQAITLAEHSPIRTLEYDVVIKDIPSYVAGHLVRHFMGVIPFVTTSRPDRGGKPRSEQKKDDPVNMQMSINAQALINISRKRLCNCAEENTRKVWQAVKNAILAIDPAVGKCMVRECVYRGFCPEIKCCGFVNTKPFNTLRNAYVKLANNE